MKIDKATKKTLDEITESSKEQLKICSFAAFFSILAIIFTVSSFFNEKQSYLYGVKNVKQTFEITNHNALSRKDEKDIHTFNIGTLKVSLNDGEYNKYFSLNSNAITLKTTEVSIYDDKEEKEYKTIIYHLPWEKEIKLKESDFKIICKCATSELTYSKYKNTSYEVIPSVSDKEEVVKAGKNNIREVNEPVTVRKFIMDNLYELILLLINVGVCIYSLKEIHELFVVRHMTNHLKKVEKDIENSSSLW